MTKGKFLYTTTIKDYKKGNADVEFSVYGLFNTEKVLWTYHVISHVSNGGEVRLTSDLCQYDMPAQYDNIKNYGKLFKTKEEGIQFIQEYRDKWEYGSNDTRQEKRDQKINDVLGGNSK